MSKKHKVAWLMVLLSIISQLFLSGCSYKDIDKRYFVLNLGIDHHKGGGNKKYTLSIKVAIPVQEKQASVGQQSTTLSIDTNSLAEGLEQLKSRLDKKVDYGHLKVLLVDPYVAEHDMATITSWFIERRDIQKIAYMAIAKPDCKTIMKTVPITEKMPSGTLLLQFGDTGSTSSYTITEYLFSFYRDLKEQGKTAILPIIESKENRIEIQTVGLFNQNKLIGELPPNETLLLNAFINHRMNYTMKMATDNNQGTASFKTIRAKIHLYASGPKPHANVHIHSTGEIGIPEKNFNKSLALKEEQLVNKKLQKEYTRLLTDLQKKNVDPIGLGLIYRSHHFNHFKEDEKWQSIYPELTFNVKVQTSFKEDGISG